MRLEGVERGKEGDKEVEVEDEIAAALSQTLVLNGERHVQD